MHNMMPTQPAMCMLVAVRLCQEPSYASLCNLRYGSDCTAPATGSLPCFTVLRARPAEAAEVAVAEASSNCRAAAGLQQAHCKASGASELRQCACTVVHDHAQVSVVRHVLVALRRQLRGTRLAQAEHTRRDAVLVAGLRGRRRQSNSRASRMTCPALRV